MRNDTFANFDTLVEKDESALIDIFEKAQVEIINRINSSDLTKRSDKLKILEQIRSVLQSLYAPTAKFITGYSNKYFKTGIDEVDKILDSAGFQASFTLIDPLVAEFLISNVQDLQDTLLLDVKNTLNFSYSNIEQSINTAINQVKRETAESVRKDLIEGIARSQILGDARTKISNNIVNNLQAEGIKALTYPSEHTKSGEVNLSLKAYAKSIARQTLVNSRASGVVAQSAKRGHDLLIISRHASPSPMCEPWGGRIVSISGTGINPDTNKPYASLKDALFSGSYTKGGGILWRWCRHSLSVYIETDIEFT